MSIRAVIFDFGGVLVRTEDQSGRHKWEERLGLSKGELARLVFDSETSTLASIGKVNEADIWSQLALHLKLSPEEIKELREDFWSGDRLDQELVQYISTLRPTYKTAILSNAWSGARIVFTEKYFLKEVVDLILISAEESIAKPDARIYQLAAERLGVGLDEAVFVDDFPENILAARTIGMHAIHFKSTRQMIDELDRLLGMQKLRE